MKNYRFQQEFTAMRGLILKRSGESSIVFIYKNVE